MNIRKTYLNNLKIADKCWHAIKDDKDVFEYDGIAYTITKRIVNYTIMSKLAIVVTAFVIAFTGSIKINNIIFSIILRAFIGCVIGILYEYVMLNVLFKEFHKQLKLN